MVFCRNCGKEINEQTAVCPYCGATQNNAPIIDDGGFWWGLLGCCLPVVGLVLYLIWKDSKPKTAKAAGIGALAGIVIITLFYLIVIAAGIGFFMNFRLILSLTNGCPLYLAVTK